MGWFPRLFGIIPLGIGLTVLYSLWFSGSGFGSPPLFFRVCGSFVALGFVMFGVAAFSAGGMLNHDRLTDLAQKMHQRQRRQRNGSGESTETGQKTGDRGYGCPKCGAELSDGADVSPSGDVKCAYCRRWFNIHRQ